VVCHDPDGIINPSETGPVKMSEDDCETWPSSRILEPEPSDYSDLAQGPDGVIYCIHEDQIVDRMCEARYIAVRRFDLDWIRSQR